MMNYYCSCKEIHEFRNGVSYEGFERSQNKEKKKRHTYLIVMIVLANYFKMSLHYISVSMGIYIYLSNK